jgi:hypothetical protein
VEFAFTGDEFELEDQRNWTDGSLKTYGKPLALGPPAPLSPGGRLRQCVELRLLAPPRHRRRPPRGGLELNIGAATALPRLGFASGAAPDDLSALAQTTPSHIRVDLRDGYERVAATSRVATAIGTGIQLGVHLPLDDSGRAALDALKRDAPLYDVLVLQRDAEQLSTVADVEHARRLLGRFGDGVRYWAGTDAYYAQINRALTAAVGKRVTFSMHPQEHASDEQSMVETLEIQRDVLLDLKSKQDCAVSLGAVTLGRRVNFSAPAGLRVPTAPPDPRQSEPFGRAWTLGSIRYLSEAGAAAATFHTISGVGGVVDTDGRPTSLHALFSDLSELGDQALLVESESPSVCTGLAFRDGGLLTLVVANLRPERLHVRIRAANRRNRTLELDHYEYVRLEARV